MLKTSAIPTESELNALNLIVPRTFRVLAEPDRVVLQFYSPPETGHRVLLFDYEILPASKPDFSGELLGVVVEDLAATVQTLYNAHQDQYDLDIMERILKIVNGASSSVAQRRLRSREFRVLTNQIYTVEEEDWFG